MASGNTAPLAAEALPPDEAPADEVTSDSTGANLIVSIGGLYDGGGAGAGIYTMAKQFPGYSPTEPTAIGAFAEGGIVDDPTTKSYLFSGFYQSCDGPDDVITHTGIVRFAESTNGSAEWEGEIPCTFSLKPLPISTITSAANCGQLALGYLRNIYAVCGSAIKVFTHDSSGNVPPLRVLSGSATRLNRPVGIYEGT